MDMTREKAWAKLNLSLDVGARREDGYHDMIMVMQTVSVCDEVSVSLRGGSGVRARTSFSFIPGDDRNLAVRAAKRYLAAVDRPGQGVEIEIKKRIPVGAGMGGGSADAAAVLRALNRLFASPLGMRELEALAADVGSDVPFCVAGGTALATGRGERLTPLPPLPECRFAICKPEFSISTPELFKKLDRVHLRRHPDTAGMLAALRQGELGELCRRMYNVFEDIDDRRLRTVSSIKNILLDCGALGAVMTGTGSAVFGIFAPGADTAAACAKLKKEYAFAESAGAVGRIAE